MLATLFFIAIVPFCFAEAISINGTCELGNCASPDILTSGQGASASRDFTYIFSNTDQYLVFVLVGTENFDETISLSLSATYLGNASGTTSQADTLTIDLLQGYAEGFTGTVGGFHENTTMYFSGPISSASSATAQWSYDGQALPLMSFAPAGPNSASFTNVTLSGLTEPLEGDWTEVFNFGAGSNVGATISTAGPTISTIPEPSSFALLTFAILCLVGSRLARKRFLSATR